MTTTDILFEVRGALGLITLNRPKVFNALTHDMALLLEQQLIDWRDNADVKSVAIIGAGEKAFCAGGDIRALYDAGRKDGRNNFKFYEDEYRLNSMIKNYPKPYVAIIDGYTMGGGVGVAIHGSHVIATERTVFAMPETGIGLFPDIGGTYFLPRLPGKIGLWLGLTGARLKGIAALSAKVCNGFIQSNLTESILKLLEDGTNPDDLPIEQEAPEFEQLNAVNEYFGANDIDQLVQKLEGSSDEWAQKQLSALRSKSPTTSVIGFYQLNAGANLDFAACMSLEYKLAQFCMMHTDFYEGVRALIIDKDNNPSWSPAMIEDVNHEPIKALFV